MSIEALAGYAKYDSYRDSGVDWLGSVPESWAVVKMKYLYRDTSIKNRADETLLSVTQDRGVIPRFWNESRVVMPSGNLESFKFIKKGDFAISLRSFEGGLEYCHHDGILSPAYTVLKSNNEKMLPKYYKYLFKSSSFISELQTSVIGIREGKNIAYSELQYSLLPVPTDAHQKNIADFLDQKIVQIDQAIKLKQQQIEKLNEYKQTTIQNAVTKGLDTNANMKDSGVLLIGDIPAHWKIKRLKYILSEKLKYGSNDAYDSEDISLPRYIRITDIGSNGELRKEGFKALSLSKSKDYLLEDNDILLARSGATVGKSFLYKKADCSLACHAGYLIRARVNQKTILPDYLNYFLQSAGYWLWIDSINIQSTIQNVSAEKYASLYISLPSIEEQKSILETLNQIDNKIRAVKLKFQTQIEQLKEYKTILINQAVTGKIKVS